MLPLSPSQCLADASSTAPLPFGSLADVLSSKSSSFSSRYEVLRNLTQLPIDDLHERRRQVGPLGEGRVQDVVRRRAGRSQ